MKSIKLEAKKINSGDDFLYKNKYISNIEHFFNIQNISGKNILMNVALQHRCYNGML